MARKNTLVYNILSNQSLSASFTSPPTVVLNHDNCSYQINITTTDSTGSFQVQVSNDYKIDETTGALLNAGNWIPLSLAGGTPNANAANDNIVINLNQLPFYAMRLAYSPTIAGTGTCSVFLCDKQVGG